MITAILLLSLLPVSQLGVNQLEKLNTKNEMRELERYEASLYPDPPVRSEHLLKMRDVYQFPSDGNTKEQRCLRLGE